MTLKKSLIEILQAAHNIKESVPLLGPYAKRQYTITKRLTGISRNINIQTIFALEQTRSQALFVLSSQHYCLLFLVVTGH